MECVRIGLDIDMEMGGADKMMYSFWQKGWIEIREMENKGKNGRGKEYTLKVRLKKIATILLKRGGTDRPEPNFPSRGRGYRVDLALYGHPLVLIQGCRCT